jgi:hypothetical protein
MSSKKLDIDKIEAALKRAARKASSGSRDAQSGRILPHNANRLIGETGESGTRRQREKS